MTLNNTEEEFTAAGEMTYKQFRQYLRPVMLKMLTVGVVIMYIIVYFLFDTLSIIGEVGLTLFYSVFVYFLIRVIFKRYYDHLFKGKKLVYTIKNDGIEFERSSESTFYNWNDLKNPIDKKSYYRIEIDSKERQALFISKTSFKSSNDLKQFENRLNMIKND